MKVDNSSKLYNEPNPKVGNPPSGKEFTNRELVDSLLRVISTNDYISREVQKLWNAADKEEQRRVAEYINNRWKNSIHKDDPMEMFVSILALCKLLEISEQEIRDKLSGE